MKTREINKRQSRQKREKRGKKEKRTEKITPKAKRLWYRQP